jgi:hypothetical protein
MVPNGSASIKRINNNEQSANNANHVRFAPETPRKKRPEQQRKASLDCGLGLKKFESSIQRAQCKLLTTEEIIKAMRKSPIKVNIKVNIEVNKKATKTKTTKAEQQAILLKTSLHATTV